MRVIIILMALCASIASGCSVGNIVYYGNAFTYGAPPKLIAPVVEKIDQPNQIEK